MATNAPPPSAHGRLFHVSEHGGVEVFEPRRSRSLAGFAEAVVWAIDESHLPNYLLPRDCPRVTFAARPDSTAADVERFLGPDPAPRVVAIESAWFQRATSTPLFLYEFDPWAFRLQDPHAGYFVAREPVGPIATHAISRPLHALFESGAELRVLASLWPLHDAVAVSTLEFSMIRMRNAPRPCQPSRS